MARNLMAVAATGALAAVLFLAGDIRAEEEAQKPEIKPQTLCPVMNRETSKELYVDQDGKRIYVCCRGCIGAVKADFEKYEKVLAERGEKPATICKCGAAGEHECRLAKPDQPKLCEKCGNSNCTCPKPAEPAEPAGGEK